MTFLAKYWRSLLLSIALATFILLPKVSEVVAAGGVSAALWENNCIPQKILGVGCQGNVAKSHLVLSNSATASKSVNIRTETFACNQGVFPNPSLASCGQNAVVKNYTVTVNAGSKFDLGWLMRSVPQINGAFCGSAQVDFRFQNPTTGAWSSPYWGFAFTNANCQSKVAPQVRTEIHNLFHQDITGTTVPAGTIVYDKAFVTGSGPTPTGTVTFFRYNSLNCSGTAAIQTGVNLSGGTAHSASFTTKTGILSYRARYNGDKNYTAKLGACEPLTIDKLTPAITTQVEDADNHPGTVFPLNSVLHDRAFVKGSGPTPTGTVTFRHFESPNCTANLIQTFSNVPLNSSTNPAVAVSGTSQRTVPQASSYLAVYNGDGNYKAVTGPCEPYTITAPPPPPEGNQGCTLGYWKNHAGTGPQANAWGPTGYSPSQLVRNVFAVPTAYAAWIANSTLLQALSFQGGSDLNGGAQILLKQAVAALLNAAYPHNVLNYPLTPSQVISQVNSALSTLNRSKLVSLGSTLDGDNNLGCPLN